MGSRFIKHGQDGLDYIRMYPRLMKWINTCSGCGAIGHKPELPEQITRKGGQWTVCAQNLRRFFKELVVNDVGLCGICGGD